MGQPTSKTARPPGGVSRGPGPRARGTNAALVTGVQSPTVPSRASAGPAAAGDAAAAGGAAAQLLPVVVRFAVPPQRQVPGGPPVATRVPTVQVGFEYDGWQLRDMSKSSEDFFHTAMVPPGPLAYKFFVNGAECIDPTQPGRPATSAGGAANIITVSDALLASRDDEAAAADDTVGWGQQAVTFEETRKLPPILPPHMRYTPLSNPPTQYRVDQAGIVAAVPDGIAVDPEHLPMPLSVTINHVYFQRRDDHVVAGITSRFKNKFTSVVYYKGDSSAVRAAPLASATLSV